MFSRISSCICPFRDKYIVNGSVESEFCLDSQLGEGKTGKVYRAYNRVSKEPVAVKIIQNTYLCTDSRIDSLNREINILFSVHHRGIIELIKVFKDEHQIAMVTELAIGGEIMDRLGHQDSKNVSEADIANIIRQIGEALQYLHQNGITHRDIKPENIIYSFNKDTIDVKLIDFGVSFKSEVGTHEMTEMAGTGHYMAPETFARGGCYGCEIDMWSLGVMLYVMLFGSYPFDAMFLSQLEDKIQLGKYTFPEDLKHHVSDDAKDLIKKLLVTDRKDRLTATQLLQHPWLHYQGGTMMEPLGLQYQRRIQEHVAACNSWKSDSLRKTAHERQDHKPSHNVYVPPSLSPKVVDGFVQL